MSGDAGSSQPAPLRSAWIPIVTVLVAWASIVVFYQIIGAEIEQRGLAFSDQDIEYAGRLLWAYFLWGVASAVFVTTGLVAAAYALKVLSEQLVQRQVLMPALVAVFAIVAFCAAFVMQVGTDFRMTDPAMRDILGPLFDRVDGAIRLRVTARALSSLGMALTIPVVAAAVGLLGGTRGGNDLATMRRKVIQLRMLLYVSATALVAGVLEAYGLHMTVMLADDSAEEVEHIRSLASAITFGLGGSYSLLLLMVYLPTNLLLRRDIVAAVPAGLSGEERTKLLEMHGLNERRFSGLWRVLAVLSPLLAGLMDIPIGQMLGALAG